MNNELTKLINDFSINHLGEINNHYQASLNTRIITNVLPRIIKTNLNLGDDYKIYGSVGNGSWSEIPWIALLDKSITTSTTRGYYVVILFDRYLKEIHLSFGVGWTQFEEEYGIKKGKLMISTVCKHYSNLLGFQPFGFKNGVIDLHAKNNLGKGYEVGAIFSKKYLIENLSDDVFLNDIRHLISVYQNLKSIVGNSILNLDVDLIDNDEAVEVFKNKIAAESFSGDTKESINKLIKIANESPPSIRLRLKKEIIRNRKFADFVKERANYICQICSCPPFIQINGKPYAEADHVIPLGGNTRGFDSPDNMRCLCAQCHAIITHGSDLEIKNLLLKK